MCVLCRAREVMPSDKRTADPITPTMSRISGHPCNIIITELGSFTLF